MSRTRLPMGTPSSESIADDASAMDGPGQGHHPRRPMRGSCGIERVGPPVFDRISWVAVAPAEAFDVKEKKMLQEIRHPVRLLQDDRGIYGIEGELTDFSHGGAVALVLRPDRLANVEVDHQLRLLSRKNYHPILQAITVGLPKLRGLAKKTKDGPASGASWYRRASVEAPSANPTA